MEHGAFLHDRDAYNDLFPDLLEAVGRPHRVPPDAPDPRDMTSFDSFAAVPAPRA